MGEKNDGKSGRMPDMLRLSGFPPASDTEEINLETALEALTKEQREKFVSGVDMRRFVKIFEDSEMMRTLDAFFANGMNVSATARALYMHRNTLMYRLKAIRKRTGLNVQSFDAAVTFKLLYIMYNLR